MGSTRGGSSPLRGTINKIEVRFLRSKNSSERSEGLPLSTAPNLLMKKIIAFGTFDIFHPGHISFLKQARRLGDYLIVVVARDKNTLKAKGKLPKNSEKTRLREVKKAKLADKVILGSINNNYFRTLRTNKIDLIALGYDQKPTISQLKKVLRKHRLSHIEIRRLKPYNPDKYKSSKLVQNN